MEILSALGVDWTIFIHMVCFGLSYVVFSNLVLKPYMKAMHEREKRTIGGVDAAARLIDEANKLQAQFEQKAKTLNTEIRGYYDQSRSEAMASYDELVSGAKAEANIVIKGAQAEIDHQIQAARTALSAEIPAVATAIASKLAGKEISL
jgi:F-type H+-transporting ATPase subunit b